MRGKAVFFLANGFEELEAVAPIDVVRRAGVETLLCAVTPDGSQTVVGSHGLRMAAECLPDALPPPGWPVFPHGLWDPLPAPSCCAHAR